MNVSLTVAVIRPDTVDTVTPQIVTSITTYINSLPVGAPLPISRIAQLAYAANDNVSNVTAISLNGQNSDIMVQYAGVIKAGTVVVN
jgi:hypothetical protein